MPKEKTAQAKIILHLGSKANTRAFRNNVGMGFMGTILKESPDIVVLKNHYRVHFGLFKGSSDIIGFSSRTIQKEDVGKKIAQFLAVECKSPRGRLKETQQNFIDVVKHFGGLAGVARTVEDAESILNEWGEGR